MSLFQPVNLVCPNCKSLVVMDAVGSINADRRPDFRDAILADRFQDTTCGSCGRGFRLQPDFNYLDAGRRQWIACLPAARLADFRTAEAEVRVLYDQSYGRNAPAAARVVGDTLDVRLTFGWPALREKLLARQEGLDDVTLELLKLDIVRNSPRVPFGAGSELRLVAVPDGSLAFVWLDSSTEKGGDEVIAERARYEGIAADPAWTALRGRLTEGPFVDVQRLYMAADRIPAQADG